MATAKAKKVIEGTVVTFSFSNGETIATDITKLTKDIRQYLALHGFSQKVGDSYAGTKDAETAYNCAKAVIERLVAGDWKAARAAGGAAPRNTKLVEALHRATGRELDECRELVGAMESEEKTEIRKHPDVAKALAEMKLEETTKAASDNDSDKSLGSLFG